MALKFEQSEAVVMQAQIADLQTAVDALKASVDTVAGGTQIAPFPIMQQADAVFQRAWDVAKAQTWFTANDAIAPPPPPPPPVSTVLGELIKSVDGTPHEGKVAGVGTGWDWYAHGVIQSASPGTNKAASGWGSLQEDVSGNPGGLAVETRNWQVWARTPTAWVRLTTGIYGSQTHPHPPHEGGVEGSMGTGPAFALPRHGMGAQWFSPQATFPAGTLGVVTLCEMRLPAGAPANTNLLVATGADFWPVAGSSSGNRGAAVGRFRQPTAGWKWLAASSLSADALRAAGSPV